MNFSSHLWRLFTHTIVSRLLDLLVVVNSSSRSGLRQVICTPFSVSVSFSITLLRRLCVVGVGTSRVLMILLATRLRWLFLRLTRGRVCSFRGVTPILWHLLRLMLDMCGSLKSFLLLNLLHLLKLLLVCVLLGQLSRLDLLSVLLLLKLSNQVELVGHGVRGEQISQSSSVARRQNLPQENFGLRGRSSQICRQRSPSTNTPNCRMIKLRISLQILNITKALHICRSLLSCSRLNGLCLTLR